MGRWAWPPTEVPHSSPPLWIPAFAGMTKWGGRNDEVGGRHDESGGRRSWQAGLASDALEALPHSSPPPLWIPAFAGMTKWGAGMTKWGAGMTKCGAGMTNGAGGRRSWEAGLASDALEALPHSSPPLWIPAFAGMTKCGAGNDEVRRRHDEVGRRNDESGGRRSWEAGLASDALEALPHSPPPLWIPAFAGMTKWGAGMTKVGRRNDEVGRRNDEVGGPE